MYGACGAYDVCAVWCAWSVLLWMMGASRVHALCCVMVWMMGMMCDESCVVSVVSGVRVIGVMCGC